MKPTMASVDPESHHALREIGPAKMAKATLTFSENRDLQAEMRAELGKAITKARMACGWSLKELAANVNRDRTQVGRWESGEENPNLAALFMLPQLRRPLCIAFSEMSGATVQTRVEWPGEERKAG